MAKRMWYYWTISYEDFKRNPGSVMDMLRYDDAIVSGNPPTGCYLLRSEHPPTEGRWQSFGIKISNQETRSY